MKKCRYRKERDAATYAVCDCLVLLGGAVSAWTFIDTLIIGLSGKMKKVMYRIAFSILLNENL